MARRREKTAEMVGIIEPGLVFYQKLGWVPANGRTAISNPPTGPTGLLTVDGLLAGRFDVVSDALHHLIGLEADQCYLFSPEKIRAVNDAIARIKQVCPTCPVR